MRYGESPLLDDEVKIKIIEAIRLGNHMSTAAMAAGISPQVLNGWIAQGEGRRGRPTPELIEFSKLLRQAEAEAEVEIVKTIRDNLGDDPASALRFLARRFPKRWGEKKNVNVNWRVLAVRMLRSGEITPQVLEAEFCKKLATEVLAELEAPQKEGEEVIDAEVDESVDAV